MSFVLRWYRLSFKLLPFSLCPPWLTKEKSALKGGSLLKIISTLKLPLAPKSWLVRFRLRSTVARIVD